MSSMFAVRIDYSVSLYGLVSFNKKIIIISRQCLWCWQNWMVAYLGYTLRMRTLFRGWPIMVNDTHTRRRGSWQSHCESSPGSFDECRTAPSGRQPKTKSDDLGFESACTGCQSLNPLSLFIIITQPESWYSFYHPIEVEGWVDLVGWLHTEMQHVFLACPPHLSFLKTAHYLYMVYPPTDGHPSWY